ncbi:translocation/assembly module TamB domain-containing protein [candidate division WOR-3 bacterium]|nr:translocation/assembly module TamB domain-containing protein [candidate division WOR-3 bacterium]
MRKTIRIILPLIFVFIILFILIKNGFVFECIRNRIIKNSGGKIRIEHVEGNLITNIVLRGVKYGDIFESPSISVFYTPWSLIVKRIKTINISFPSISLSRDVAEGFSLRFYFPFNISNFNLINGTVSGVPGIKTIKCLNLTGLLKKGHTEQIFQLKNGEGYFEFWNRLIKIQNIEGKVGQNFQSAMTSINLIISTDSSRVELSGDIIPARQGLAGGKDSIDFKFIIPKFSLHEIVQGAKGILTSDLHLIKSRDQFSMQGWAKLNKVKYKKMNIGNLDAHLSLLNKDLEISINNWATGKSSLKGLAHINLVSPFSYNVLLKGNNIDILDISVSRWTARLPTNLNGQINLQGKGREFCSVLNLSGLVKGTTLDSLYARVLYSETGVKVISLGKLQDKGSFSIKGNIAKDNLKLSLLGKKVNLTSFLSGVSGASNFDFVIKGTPRNPSIIGTFYIKDFKFGEITSDYFSGNLQLVNLSRMEGNGEFDFANLTLYKNKFETFKAVFTANQEYTNYEITGYDDFTELELKGNGKGENFTIHTLSLNTPNLQLSNSDDILFQLKYRQGSQPCLLIRRCNLALNDSLFQITGLISRDKLALSMTGNNLDLRGFSNLPYRQAGTLNGIINFTSDIKGTIINPIISLSSEIKNFSYLPDTCLPRPDKRSGTEPTRQDLPDSSQGWQVGQFIKADRILLSLFYNEHLLHIKKCELIKRDERVQISGEIPIALPFRPLNEQIALNLALFNSEGEILLYPYRKFAELEQGKINANLNITGTLKQPYFSGTASLNAKSLLVRFLGTTLQAPRAQLSFSKDTIKVTSFSAKTERGNVSLRGYIQPKGQLDFKINVNKLPIKSIEYVNALVSGDVIFQGPTNNPTLKHNVKVENATITMPFDAPRRINLQYPVDYDLTIDFPGHVWIRNPQTDAEIEGKVNVRKKGSEFFLSGPVTVKEGYYYYRIPGTYLDRAFKIKRGEFKFTNSPELNPDISLLASSEVDYTISMADTMIDTSCVVELEIKGTLREPEFSLSSVPSMSLQDIVSLLSLNMTADELLKLQDFEYPKMGERVLSYFLRTKMLNVLRAQMGIDALRLETELELLGKEKSARFNIGKYILKDLYISYTQDLFSASKYEFKAKYSPWKYGSLIGERTEEGEFKTGLELKVRY